MDICFMKLEVYHIHLSPVKQTEDYEIHGYDSSPVFQNAYPGQYFNGWFSSVIENNYIADYLNGNIQV